MTEFLTAAVNSSALNPTTIFHAFVQNLAKKPFSVPLNKYSQSTYCVPDMMLASCKETVVSGAHRPCPHGAHGLEQG